MIFLAYCLTNKSLYIPFPKAGANLSAKSKVSAQSVIAPLEQSIGILEIHMKKSILSTLMITAFTNPVFANWDSGLNLSDQNDSYVSVKSEDGTILGYVDKDSGAVVKVDNNGGTEVVGVAKIKGDAIHITDGERQIIGSLGEKNEHGNDFIVDTTTGDWTPDNGLEVPTDPDFGITPPVDNELPPIDLENALDYIYEQGSAAYNDLTNEMFLFKDEVNQRFKDMDARIDNTNASLHAVTNARPMVMEGQTAFGVGTGFAGSASAIAIGVAHSFEDTGWSASATVNATTGSQSEFNGGAGLQYAF